MARARQVGRGVQRAIARVADVGAPTVTRRFAGQWRSLQALPDDIRPRIFFPVWIVCGVVCAVLISIADSGNQNLYTRLERDGVVVSAVVTRTEPSNHGIVYYRFDADGRTNFSAAPADSPNPLVEQIKPGDHLHVVYDLRDPEYSCACSSLRSFLSASPRALSAPRTGGVAKDGSARGAQVSRRVQAFP